MKKTIEIYKVVILSIYVGLCSCAREEAIPVTVDFSYEVFQNDLSVPVQLVLFNDTEGADDFEWTFEGGTPSQSIGRNPGVVTYNESGTYTIELSAANRDGSSDMKKIEVEFFPNLEVNFEVVSIDNNFSPARFSLLNTSKGASDFSWFFEGGSPTTSVSREPGEIIFHEPGEHDIILTASNEGESKELKKTIEVAPLLHADFEFEIDDVYGDMQIPIEVSFTNKSISATSYQWSFQGSTTTSSNETNPVVVFTEPGTHTIRLTATNGKETQLIEKKITFLTDSNLIYLEDVKFGINTAHTRNSVGSFFSLEDQKVYANQELDFNISKKIDLVYYGFNNTFAENRFVSPDNLEETTFSTLETPKHTTIINKLESCNCTALLTIAEFDSMTDDSLLAPLLIEELDSEPTNFDNSITPRIILFKTQEGIKGAIKIKEFIDQGRDSYILTDIKTQKRS